LVDGRVVSRGSVEEMITPPPVSGGFTPPYGLGVSRLPLAEQPAVWHTGVMGGFMTVLAYLPEQDVIVAAAGNSRHALLAAIVKRVVRRVSGSTKPTLLDLPVSAADVERAVGAYDDGLFTFRIVADGGALYVDAPQIGVRERLLYQGEHAFAV